MGNWSEIFDEIAGEQLRRGRLGPADVVRRKYLGQLNELTGRNVVAYYSGWLQRPGPDFAAITMVSDEDKNGFMSCFHGMDWSKGLDLILHLPGGSGAAAESIIDYIRAKFGTNVRTIVPQISMSAGTMIVCAGRQIVMGSHSNLGPIDPQFGSWPAIAVLKEFDRATQEVTQEPKRAMVWQPILSKYQPTLLSQAQHAIEWSKEIGIRALRDGMFADQPDAQQRAEQIVEFLLSHDVHRAHGRHLHRKELRDRGLDIVDLEADPSLQDAVLSLHHAFMNTLMNTPTVKIIENHKGVAIAKTMSMQVQLAQIQAPVAAPPPPPPAPLQRLPFLARLLLACRLLLRGA